MKSNSRLFFLFGVFLVSFVSVGTAPLWSQTASTGALTGTVTDPSGGAVPSAIVTLLNNATSQGRTTTTGTNGSYALSLLPPGNYLLKVSAPRFKTLEVPSVTVNVTETPVRDVTLEVGASAEQVTVTGDAETIQTQSASNGTLVESKMMTALPLTTRNYTQVLSLSGGVVANVNNAANLGRGSVDMNVNGQSLVSNNYQMDGTDANSWASGSTSEFVGLQNGGISIPNPDAIAEFKIQTSQFDAGYGRNSGANVNVITKSGGNSFHGSLFEFVRNDIFNANDFFRNRAGQPRPNLKQNQFGGVIGGPIKKDKFFFFGSYQGSRQVNGLSSFSLSNNFLPPLTNDRSAGTIGTQFCPANHPGDSRYPTFAGGTQVACNGSNINAVALNLLQLKLPDGTYFVPTPQTIITSGTNAGLGFSSYSVPAKFREDQAIVNLDYVISSKHTFSERYFISRVPEDVAFVPGVGSTVPGTPATATYLNQTAGLKLTSVVTNNLVNEARFGWNQIKDQSANHNVPTAASIGQTPPNLLFPFMTQTTVNGTLGVFSVGGSGSLDGGANTRTLEWSDQISWIHGKQLIRAGVSFDYQSLNLTATGRSRGQTAFQNFSDFLVGQSALQNGSPAGLSNVFSSNTLFVGTGDRGAFAFYTRAKNGSAFVQDDIKVNSRFTLNLGLRWEYIGEPYDANGQWGINSLSLLAAVPIPLLSGTYVGFTMPPNYNPNTVNPTTGQPFGLPTGVVIRPHNGLTSNGPPKDSFAPRFGFAWQPGRSQGRLVVRGGYGWFYQRFPAEVGYGQAEVSPPFALRATFSGASNSSATFQKPFPSYTFGFPLRTPTSTRSDSTFTSVWYNPYVQTFNLGVQYQIVPTLTLDIGYLGNRGTHLLEGYQTNQPLLASPSHPVNCGYNGGDPTNSANCITTNTSANASLRVPIMGILPTGLTTTAFDGDSWYHSLQATLRKQFSRGLSFQAAYTFSRAETDFGGYLVSGAPTYRYNDPNNRQSQWGLADFDRRQRLIVNYYWELPNLYKDHGIASKVLSGWSIAGVGTTQVGTPLTLSDPTGARVYGQAAPATITLCPGMTPASIATSGRSQSRLSAWYNVAAICAPPAVGDDGSTGYGNTGRTIITGPGQFNWDVSLGKTTKVGGLREGALLEFRTEFYNAFNHPQFSNPGTARGSSTFGVITSTSVAPRLIQFGLKYIF